MSEEQQQIKKQRKSAKQASETRVQAKKELDDYNHRFKLAFKAGTDLVNQQLNGNNQPASEFFSVNEILLQLNGEYQLNGQKKLSRSTLYRAVNSGHVGASPLKRDPPRAAIPDILLDVVAIHTEMSQLGKRGKLRGRDIKRTINAAVMGTKFEVTFQAESV